VYFLLLLFYFLLFLVAPMLCASPFLWLSSSYLAPITIPAICNLRNDKIATMSYNLQEEGCCSLWRQLHHTEQLVNVKKRLLLPAEASREVTCKWPARWFSHGQVDPDRDYVRKGVDNHTEQIFAKAHTWIRVIHVNLELLFASISTHEHSCVSIRLWWTIMNDNRTRLLARETLPSCSPWHACQ
jgi:hypothetical protein